MTILTGMLVLASSIAANLDRLPILCWPGFNHSEFKSYCQQLQTILIEFCFSTTKVDTEGPATKSTSPTSVKTLCMSPDLHIPKKTFNEIHLSRYQTSTTTRRPALASLTSVYADKCGIRSSGYRPDQVPMMAMGRIIKLVCYFLFFDGSHFLPASTPGSDHCAGLTELWSNSASCWFLPMAGQSLS